MEFPKDGDGCRWNSTPHERQTRVRRQGVDHIKVHQHRPAQGGVKTVSVKREGRRWFVVLSCDDVPTDPLPETGSQVGIDVGMVHFATTSSGEYIENPRHGQQVEDELAHAQRHLATFRKRKPANRTKAHRQTQQKVSRLHRKVARQRADHHHKTALDMVRSHDVIAHEQLNIAGMTRRHDPKPDPDTPGEFLPNQASAKAGLNKSVLDAGWEQFLTIPVGKAEKADRRTVGVDARNTSRTCLDCRHVDSENRSTQTNFTCVQCAFTANADVVGAVNVARRAGLVLDGSA